MFPQVNAILVRGSSPVSSTVKAQIRPVFQLDRDLLYGDQWMRDPRLVLAMLDGIDDYVFGAYL